MSLNSRGKLVGQVVRPGVTLPDRGQKRRPTVRSQPPVPPEDIIEISSSEDDQPPPKKIHTRRLPSISESDYQAQLSQKDQQIEKLKGVRH